MHIAIQPPGERFNIAAHLLAANAGRPAKAAFIDDAGTLTYGQLDERVRRLAAGLRAMGLKREERVLLLMQDTTDWPVSFLGLHLMPTVQVFLGCLSLYAALAVGTRPFGGLDWLAIAVTGGAVWIEAQADQELLRFRRSRPPACARWA